MKSQRTQLFKRLVQRLSMSALCVLALGACDDGETATGGCVDDQACARGQICQESACVEVGCAGIAQCPGTGRTCLLDLKTCSLKECGDVVGGAQVACSAPRSHCVEDGAFRFSCVDPMAVSCGVDVDCVAVGADLLCCDGLCAAECSAPQPDTGIPTGDDAGVDAGDAGPETDGGPEPDATVIPGDAHLCSVCNADADCASLGEGAKCTPIGADGSFCSTACGGDDDCAPGFACVNGLNQCLPTDFRCVACLVTPCADGSVCDTTSGECVAPRSSCGACAATSDCADGFTCEAFNDGHFCLGACADGACGEGLACEDNLCKPASGECDPCGGTCTGEAPVCIPEQGVCGQCAPGVPCEAPLTCEFSTYTCVERGAGCVNDADCFDSGMRICLASECVACLIDTDCGAGFACTPEFSCVEAPCGGLECQNGSVCNDAIGRCDPGCQTNQDCALPDDMLCNAVTGQCYYINGGCDIAGAEGMCSPGSTCAPDALGFHSPADGQCSCIRNVPNDPVDFSERISCQPGVTCYHQEFLPGFGVPDEGVCTQPLF